ncbi:hypothetical protein [Stenotrophomonas pigmentata]|uniref:hypothetical protein n=1 Tax=Stenotrophomonas pigmentata TaxID=3055080 RepID=UPI0026F304FA|nr:hypothetical protein [Stenotrophomonas sp. 610A2]
MKIKHFTPSTSQLTLFAQSVGKASPKFPPVEFSRAHDKNKRIARIAQKMRALIDGLA